MIDRQYIRKLENSGQWAEAAKLWRSVGEIEDADACQMIIDANTKGDAYRRDLLETAGPMPEVCDPADSIKWQEWNKVATRVYNKHYQQNN